MTPKSVFPLNGLAIAALIAGSLHADVKPNPLFSDGAVLQRGQPVPVWGTARDGEKVTVEFGNQKISTTAADGKWSVNLQPLKEGGPFTMKITGDNAVTVNNLLVGEVWVCSGQSNMEWTFAKAHNAKEEGPKAKFPKIRMFTVKKTISAKPLTEAAGSWVECSEQWEETIGRDYQETLKSWQEATAKAKEAGEPLPPKPKPASPQLTPPLGPEGGQRDPATLFNGMLAPVIPYAIKGAIWYQGEGNARQSKQYRTLFPAMIADWRARWKQGDFPFLFVQIAPHNSQPPEIREAQLLTLSKAKNTAMAVTTDVGNATDIHPTQKEPVGQRLALAARALAYGEKIEYSGPLFDLMKAKGGKITVTFKHAGGGLVGKGGELKGFTIAGPDNAFVPAQAEIQGSTVVVSAEGVTAPKAVRYGWVNVPDVNLYNQEGLPASPFRSDVD